MSNSYLASLTRIADFGVNPYDVHPLEQSSWESGDYVLTEVIGRERTELYVVEDCDANMVSVAAGDRIVGALGRREATLEGVGSYDDVVRGEMHAMTSAGLIGAFTSLSTLVPRPMRLAYRGHIARNGKKVTMRQFAIDANGRDFDIPTVLIIGTSMSAGKSVAGRRICEILSSRGLDIVGAKLTGAGRYRDIKSFERAGANHIFDFVDAGLPSTVVDESVFRAAIRPLLRHIASLKPDILVAETGASPLEPYNVQAAIHEVGDNIACIILAASDPYAVVGVEQAFGVRPDLVAGPAASTSAAIALVEKLCALPAINVIDRETMPQFSDFLAAKLRLPPRA